MAIFRTLAPVDLEGNPVERTKRTHPYSYEAFVLFDFRKKGGPESNAGAYSDRMMQWDWNKHNNLLLKHYGDQGQSWNRRDPDSIEAYLRDYFDKPELRLCYVLEGCNVSNGYPYWYFGWHEEREGA